MTDSFLILMISGKARETGKMSEVIMSVCPSLRIKSATSGKEAFFLLQEWKKESVPAAIVIDYMLPDITGLEFFKIISESAKYRDIPVLVMSGTYVEPGDRAAALIAGASGFIQKPVFESESAPEEMLRWGEAFCRELAYQLKVPYKKLCGQNLTDL